MYTVLLGITRYTVVALLAFNTKPIPGYNIDLNVNRH